MGKKIIVSFASTLTRLVGPGLHFASIVELEKKCGVGKSTLNRARSAETATKIDNVEDIAKAFGLDAWQMLVPGVDPKNPPMLIGDAEGLEHWPLSRDTLRRIQALKGNQIHEAEIMMALVLEMAERADIESATQRQDPKKISL